jgi:hypothetical protein
MWKLLKQLLVSNDEKVVIMEDGTPRYVVLSVAEYLRLRSAQSAKEGPQHREESFESVGNQPPPTPFTKEVQSVYNEPPPFLEPESPARDHEPPSEISLEDLPF